MAKQGGDSKVSLSDKSTSTVTTPKSKNKTPAPPEIHVVIPGSGADSGPYGLGKNGLLKVTRAYDVVQGQATGHPLTVDSTLDYYYALAKSNPGQLAQIQQALYQAKNFYPANYKLIPGVIRQEDFNAFKEAALQAAHSGVPLLQYITTAASMGDALGTTTHTRVPFVATPPNPADLRKIARDKGAEIYGSGAPQSVVEDIVRSYTASHIAAQKAEYEAKYGPSGTEYDPASGAPVGAGGVVPQPPDAGVFAEERLRAANPAQARATDLSRGTQKFMDIIHSAVPTLAQF